ncbi:MAG: patatin-like phospholipase family protein [Candidatus Methylomirabilales bacterium]
MSRTVQAALGLACALLLTGCASATPVSFLRASPNSSCIVPAPDGDLLLGVALSGGGSRAAVFGAAALEALGRLRVPGGGSVLEQIGYLSSVSGGSLAAAYYAEHKPPRETPVLTSEGSYTDEYQAFFTRFHERIAQNFESALIRRQLGSFRWLNSALAARSLEDVLEERLLGEVTLGALSARQLRGDIPGLMINTTLFNNGRRLIVTTMPPDVARYDVFADLRRAAASRGDIVEFVPLTQRMWEGLMAVTPLDLRVDPCPIPVAAAVAASASFPPLVGPITFRVEGEATYWHAGDGGLYENAGVETLYYVFLKKLQEKKARRALIFSFDSSFPFEVAERLLGRRSEPFSIFTYDFTRIPGIMEQRAYAYQHLFLSTMRLQGVIPDPNTLRVIFLDHTDAEWRGDLSDLPEACRREEPPLRTPTEVTERLAEIPTRFKIISECDRQLLVTAAAKVVAQSREEIEAFLAGTPVPERTAR